ncbi:hypothetical protein HYH03_000440 [Edaphochlamys debaryana]|uniref:Guanylate cyclase domain-containing protein n=1 Tax=Edaphochlamys debaryana TaxID=47281 RepID=A0A836C7N0_9CHLO|nr:hypothetical protein HYH03_000440 [Edaphochlamys debaryana]|eukprot:KAG2501942.1 hypothetical protein HYH03_000440 [Edaphochlamys debaryana]
MRDSKDLSRDGDLRLSAGNNLAGSGANNAQPSHSLLQLLTAANPNSRRQQRGSKTGMTGAGAAAAATASGSPMTTAEALAAADEDASLTVSCTWGDMLEAAFPLLLADSPEGRRVHALLRAGTMHSGDAATEAGDEEGQEGDGWGAAAVATHSVAAMERAPVLRLPDGRVAVVAYRGLRVRMGLHSGLTDPAQVAFNRVVSSYAYKGDFAEVAKLVSDAAPGGLITLSHYAFARLRHTEPGSAAPAPADPSHHHHHHHHHHHDRRGSIDRRTSRDQGHPHLLDGLFRIGHGRDDHAAKDGGLQGAVVLYAGTHVLTEPKPRTVISKLLPAVRSRVALTLLGEGETPHASTPQAPLTPSETTLGSGPGLGPGPVAEALEFSRVDEATPHVQHHQQSIPEDGPPAYDRPTLLHGAPLEGTDDPHALFLAAHPSLLCRLALRPQLRVVRTLKLGSLGAPVRRVTVAFMKVVGASVILADLPGPGARALDAFQRITGTLLAPGGGFKVEGADGLVLAVFGSPMAAVRWACTCSAALAQYAWEEALLSHELCQEEVGVAAAAELSGCHAFGPGSQSPRGTLRRQPCGPLLRAGPRIKVGLDIGTTTHTLTSASGRLSYRGKPMNRAARIAGIGAAGQVLCSGDTWEACAAEDPRLLDRYSGVSLGCMALKGVAQPLEVVQVLPEAATFG